MSAQSNADLARHVGHHIECCIYFDGHAAIECLLCQEVLLDFPDDPEPTATSHTLDLREAAKAGHFWPFDQ